MSNALDHKETEFALKVRRALDENINSLPAASLDKLAAARRTAIARGAGFCACARRDGHGGSGFARAGRL
jgi:hypothetical protein